ncbi:MAG: hypothetical protein ACKPKO_21990, partial [Candidatus Fonsibacter sp.]
YDGNGRGGTEIKIERYKDDLIRQNAQNTRQPTQVLRAGNRRQFVPNTANLVYSRTDDDYQAINDEIDSQRYESNAALLARIRAMGNEASSSINSIHGVSGGLTNLSASDSVRRVSDTFEGLSHVVLTG